MKIIKTILLAGIISAGFNNNYAVNDTVNRLQAVENRQKLTVDQRKDLDQRLLDACNLQQPNLDDIQKLLQAGAQPDIQNEYGSTPLHWAALNGHAQVVKLLIEAHAQLDKQDKDGETPLHSAAWRDVEVAKLLLEAGARPDKQDKDGITPLHWAAKYDYAQVVKLLLEAGAHPDKQDNDGMTPLFWATKYGGRAEVVKLLLGAGAQPDMKDDYGSTPLYFAAKYGHTDVAALLTCATDYLKEGLSILHKGNNLRFAPTIFGMAVARKKVTDMARIFDLCNQEDSITEAPNLNYYINLANKLHKKESVEELYWLKDRSLAQHGHRGLTEKDLKRAPDAFKAKYKLRSQRQQNFLDIHFCYAKDNKE